MLTAANKESSFLQFVHKSGSALASPHLNPNMLISPYTDPTVGNRGAIHANYKVLTVYCPVYVRVLSSSEHTCKPGCQVRTADKTMVDVQRGQKRFDRMISGYEAHLRVASRGFIGGLPHSLWQPLQLHTLRSLSQADEVVSNTGRQSVQLLCCEVPYSSPREQLEQLPVPFKVKHIRGSV